MFLAQYEVQQDLFEEQQELMAQLAEESAQIRQAERLAQVQFLAERIEKGDSLKVEEAAKMIGAIANEMIADLGVELPAIEEAFVWQEAH